MADVRTDALKSLLENTDQAVREAAWERFVAGYSGIILYIARRVCGDRDGAMDGYALVLEQLRADDFRRLRHFIADGRSEFSTWLLVVAQRICLDEQRRRFGRIRGDADGEQASRGAFRARNRLANLAGADIDLAGLPDNSNNNPESLVREAQMHQAVESALQKLAPRERLMIKLRFEDQLGMPDIAQALELPSRFHAYRMLKDVLAKLKESLTSNGVKDGEP
jgi:RNA polymerase sigma factor (sigma-70 family)